MSYIDTFVLAVNKSGIDGYRELAEANGRIWREHGAIEYFEHIGDEVPYGKLTSFPRAIAAKEDQVIILGIAVYTDKAARDAANAKIMTDPRLGDMMERSAKFGVDAAHMIYGGFETLVELT